MDKYTPASTLPVDAVVLPKIDGGNEQNDISVNITLIAAILESQETAPDSKRVENFFKENFAKITAYQKRKPETKLSTL